jgi:hypothetical protein
MFFENAQPRTPFNIVCARMLGANKPKNKNPSSAIPVGNRMWEIEKGERGRKAEKLGGSSNVRRRGNTQTSLMRL